MEKNIIKVSHLQKRFGQNLVLKDISFNVKRSEKIAIIGPSGGGKSTLLRCLNRLEHNYQGIVKFNNKNIQAANSAEIRTIRQKIGMVFQQFNLFPHKTVLGNIIFAPVKLKLLSKRKAFLRAHRLLANVGLNNKANAYPHSLSGGQKQRVAIARSLAMHPSVMLFDEPTSALDPEMVGDVLNVMTNLANKGMTMIIVTHEISFAKKIADKILFMDKGVIFDKGSPDYIFHKTKNRRTQTFLSKVRG